MNGLKEELKQLDTKSLRRALRTVEQIDGNHLVIEGRKLLNFSSNNYLGLARHPQVIEAVKQVIDHWGTGATSSRLISGTSIIHQGLENALAAFVGKEAALLFPTGYQANLGVVTSLVGLGDAIIIDRLSHASLVDAARLSRARLFVYKHADVQDAERALKRAASYRRRLLVTESLFSMDGDFAPLADLLRLARQYEAISLVDEAHAIGVWGENGRGVIASLTAGEQVTQRLTTGDQVSPTYALQSPGHQMFAVGSPAPDVIVGTLSKSLGSQGGFVAGSRELVDTLINKARSFIYTTGLSPACVAAAQAALSLAQDDPAPRRRVQNLSKQLREGLHAQGWNTLHSQSQIVPILLPEPDPALKAAERLQEAGFYAPAIRPPTVHAGECRIRFSVTAEHTEADVNSLLEVLKDVPSPLAGEGGRRPGEGTHEAG